MQRWLRLAAAALMSLAVMSCGDDGGCPTGFTDCGGFCFNLDVDPTNCGACTNACETGEVCGIPDGGETAVCSTDCPDGQVDCGGFCASLDTDGSNCGACGAACAPGEFCLSGTCGVTCGGGTSVCGDECRDLQTDPNNCGACGTACAGNEVCSGGSCAFNCGGGLPQCSGTCTDTTRDRANCGACGTACGADSLCVDSACVRTCAPGLTDCGEQCVDTSSSTLNCGGCGMACSAGQVCRSGACTTECGGATPDLCTVTGEGGTFLSCVDFDSNPDFCGSGDVACAAGEGCSAGGCGVVCDTGLTDCDGACVDLVTNANNCGACGESCPAVLDGQALCADSVCGAACAPGFFDCNLDASSLDGDGCEVELATDVDNCGACGVSCEADNAATACTMGACEIATCDAGFEDCDMVVANGCEVEVDFNDANCGACGTACGAGEACFEGECFADATQTGEDCTTPIVLSPGTASYDWAAREADHFLTPISACSSQALTGPDVVFSYTPTASNFVTIELTPPPSTRWHMTVTDAPCGDLRSVTDCDSQFGNPMQLQFEASMGTTYYVYVRDTTSGANPLDNPISVTVTETIPPAGCALGTNGIVAGTVTRVDSDIRTSFTEYTIRNASGGATSGEVLLGSTSVTYAIDKATGANTNIEGIVPLLTTEQGYTLEAAGNDWFTIDETTGANRVYRITTDGGATFLPTPEVVGTEPTAAARSAARNVTQA